MKKMMIAAGATLLVAVWPAPSQSADVFLAAATKDGTPLYLRGGGRGRRASRFIRIYSPSNWARWTNTRQRQYDRRIDACGLSWYTTDRVIRVVQNLRADENEVFVVVRQPRSAFGIGPQPQGLARYRRLC